MIGVRKIKKIYYKAIGVGGTGLDFKPRLDDFYIAGYPKSGNTWLDFIVASIIKYPDYKCVNFETINKSVADIHSESPLKMNKMKSPRILKTHFYHLEYYRRGIYIVRNPNEVAVSYYYYYLKNRIFDETYSLSNFVKDWVDGNWGKAFQSWGKHTESWLNNVNDQHFLILKYEDLKLDCHKEIKKIIKLLSLELEDSSVDEIVKWCSAENMYILEKKGLEKGFSGYKNARKDIQFVRTSNVKNRIELTDIDKTMIRSAWGGTMEKLGY
jgi:hypothetical protein